MSQKIIALDFDGTLVTHAYPEIGSELPNCFRVLKKLQAQGCTFILNTMRSGDLLQEAIDYVTNNGVSLWGINKNPDQKSWTDSPKVYAHLYIDDAALGCPTLYDENTRRNRVNWLEVEAILIRTGYLIS